MKSPKNISELTSPGTGSDLVDSARRIGEGEVPQPKTPTVGPRQSGGIQQNSDSPNAEQRHIAEFEDLDTERRIERIALRRAERIAARRRGGANDSEQFDHDLEPSNLTSTPRVSPMAAPLPTAAAAIGPAKMRKRHYGVLLSLIAMVFLPIALSGWYLWTRAVDQYESHVGFAVRAEGQSATPDLFGGLLGAPSSSTAEDMNILNEFILSQEIVSLIDAKLDLRARYSVPLNDPVFSFDTSGTIEDLVAFWGRMVKVDYNTSSGLMELTVYAFTPQDAQQIAAAVLEESTKVINDLTAIAREDSTRFARETLESARARAAEARSALAAFRQKNKVADPTADITSQMGVVNSLQQQLATALIELDLIRANGKANDPRIIQLERRITAIEGRIDQERSNLGVGSGGADFAELLSEYERLNVEKSFAEQTYLAALAGFDGAMSSASQQSRYLANYVPPTLAQASTAPDRPVTLLVVALIAFFLWSSIVLIYYALRDRR